MTNSPKHFLDLDHFQEAELRSMLDAGNAFRKGNARGTEKPLEGKVLACIFEKPSTRTRLSFDVGMKQLGGEVVVITPSESQLGHGESIADTARVLSRYVDAIMIRTTTEDKLLELAEYATVPVINGLTDRTHPCQLMADIFFVIFHAVMASMMLSLLGILGGLWSEKFDHIAAVTNFVIMPFSFLSGTFYSITRLPEPFYTLTQFNPFFYMIDGFRYGFIGQSDSVPMIGVAVMLGVNTVLFLSAWRWVKSGYKLKA